MIESDRAKVAVFRRLRDDATLTGLLGGGVKVHDDPAPAGTATPFVTLAVASAEDLTAMGPNRIWQDVLLGVNVYGRGALSGIVPIADRVDALLEGYAAVQDGVSLDEFTRERTQVPPPEIDTDGVRYPHIYLEYRTRAATP